MSEPVRNILVATDLSPAAEAACARAGLLAARHGARLTLLYALPSVVIWPPWGDFGAVAWVDDDALRDSAQTRLDVLAQALAQRHGIACSARLEIGPLLPVLERVAAESAVELVVIGATGEGALARRLLGSTAQSLLAHALQQSLLVVRQPAFAPYRKLLAAVQFEPCAEHAARYALRLVPDAELALFHALERPFWLALWQSIHGERAAPIDAAAQLVAARERLQQFAGQLGQPQALLQVHEGRASHELDAVLAAATPDLVVLGAPPPALLAHGALRRHVAAEAPCDVLVVAPALRSPVATAGRGETS